MNKGKTSFDKRTTNDYSSKEQKIKTEEEEKKDENLFVLSVTLSNNKTYLVEVKKNMEPK